MCALPSPSKGTFDLEDNSSGISAWNGHLARVTWQVIGGSYGIPVRAPDCWYAASVNTCNGILHLVYMPYQLQASFVHITIHSPWHSVLFHSVELYQSQGGQSEWHRPGCAGVFMGHQPASQAVSVCLPKVTDMCEHFTSRVWVSTAFL